MENLLSTPADHIADTLTHDFEPITLQRPMKLFKGALTQAKTIGVPFTPDPEFLVRLTTDYRSHQAIVRESAGEHFKNFENFIRGRHKLSSITMTAMSQKIGLNPGEIAQWVHGNQDGPLLPAMLKLFAQVESLPYRFASHAMDAVVLCPCCKNNILDDRDAFWTTQTIAFNAPEYAFVERMLNATIGAGFFYLLLINFTGKHLMDWPQLYALAHPDRHPVGNWLAELQISFGVDSLADLVIKMQQMDSPECNVPYDRLKKWSSGMDLMPLDVAKALSIASGENNKYWMGIFLVRTLSFIVDFLVAAAPGIEPERSAVQAIVHDRFTGLGQNLRIAMAKKAKESAQAEQGPL